MMALGLILEIVLPALLKAKPDNSSISWQIFCTMYTDKDTLPPEECHLTDVFVGVEMGALVPLSLVKVSRWRCPFALMVSDASSRMLVCR